jgi:hypothetical protein
VVRLWSLEIPTFPKKNTWRQTVTVITIQTRSRNSTTPVPLSMRLWRGGGAFQKSYWSCCDEQKYLQRLCWEISPCHSAKWKCKVDLNKHPSLGTVSEGCGGQAPCILNLGTRKSWIVQRDSLPTTGYPRDKRRSVLRRGKEVRKCCPCRESNSGRLTRK